MDSNFFQNKEMHYNELGVVLEDFNYTKKAKVYIGVLLPEVQGKWRCYFWNKIWRTRTYSNKNY